MIVSLGPRTTMVLLERGLIVILFAFHTISGIDLIGMVQADLECPSNASGHMATSMSLSPAASRSLGHSLENLYNFGRINIKKIRPPVQPLTF